MKTEIRDIIDVYLEQNDGWNGDDESPFSGKGPWGHDVYHVENNKIYIAFSLSVDRHVNLADHYFLQKRIHYTIVSKCS